jgi:hypothetical protein
MPSELSEKLKAEGWVERFTASGSRLEEAIEAYHELGHEVKTVPFKELDPEACTVCFNDPADETVMIFTREKNLQD